MPIHPILHRYCVICVWSYHGCPCTYLQHLSYLERLSYLSYHFGDSTHCTKAFLLRNSFKVEPYLIPGSFLKLKYLKTEINVDNDTYAIVWLTSHSYRIMINLSIICYFELIWHPLRTYLSVFRFCGKMSRLTLYLKTKLYHLIIHVFGKVQGPI